MALVHRWRDHRQRTARVHLRYHQRHRCRREGPPPPPAHTSHPTALLADAVWTIPSKRPKWMATLARSDKLQPTHSLYDDLRHAEKTNSDILWIEQFHNVVIPLLRERNDAWAAKLRPLLQAISEQKAALDLHEADAMQPSAEAEAAATGAVPEDLDAVDLFRRVLSLASGLSGKEPARIEVVSPLLLPEAKGRPVEDLLAGEFLLHFGGFLDERLRWHDFALGFRTMQTWLASLEQLGVALDAAEKARAAAAKGTSRNGTPDGAPGDWGTSHGGIGFSSRGLRLTSPASSSVSSSIGVVTTMHNPIGEFLDDSARINQSHSPGRCS